MKNVRRKCISLLVILILLTANIGFIPNAYAASAGSASNSLQASYSSGNSGIETPTSLTDQASGTEASSQNDSAAGSVPASASSPSIAPPMMTNNESLTASVYSNNPNIIDKVIDYPAVPSNFTTSGANAPQADSFHMMHVIHMPNENNRPTAPTKVTNQNGNNSSVAGSVYGSVYASPSALAITDLNLVDTGQGQNESSAAGSVSSVENPSSQSSLNQASVASSVYSSFPIRNKAGRFTAGFSRQAGSSLFQFSCRNVSLTLAPLSPASVTGSVYQNSITYQEIYPDTDLKYTVEPNCLKEALTIKQYTGQSDFLFQLGVSDAVYKVVYGSTVLFCDPTSGEPLFFMPRPVALDKNGKRIDLNIEFTKDGLLQVSIDPSWLKNAAYPVVIDPSIVLVGGGGVESWWNYTGMDLGGGWKASVNTWNLNLFISKPLFSIPGRGMALGESITYNSASGAWVFGNNTSLVVNSDGSVTYNKSDGGSYTFTPNGSGGYTAPPGVYLTLINNSAGNFTIQDKYNNQYNYVNGKPYQFKDRNNNTTIFTYNASGQLSQLSDPSGRTLTYGYDSSGDITSVTDPASHVYQFGYQNGLLTTMTDPANNTYTLAYDANGHPATFTDPLGRVTTFNINSSGQLQWIQDARTSGQNIYQTSFTQSLQGGSMVTTVTDPGNRTTTYYHDDSTGNLTELEDGMNDTWNYTWTDNNLYTSQDAKGTTSYYYDQDSNVQWGNLTTKITTVDSNPSDNITETMTYDNYNQLLTYTDGSGRTTNYEYTNEGNLLSTANPDTLESNGRLYDQYGNVIQYSPTVQGDNNLIQNGSMKSPGTEGSPPADWIAYQPSGTGGTAGLDNSWAPYGNYSLKISSAAATTDEFYQWVSSGVNPGDLLTLRADVNLSNVQYTGASGGVIVELCYLYGVPGACGWGYDYWYCSGSGTRTIVVTSQAPSDLLDAYVYVDLCSASGTAWIDGVQLVDAGASSTGYILSAFNSVENSGFENGLNNWTESPVNIASVTSTTCWEGSNSLEMQSAGTVYQDVPVHGNEPLTFSGMVRTSGVSGGNGVYCKIDYYNASNNLISGASVQTGYVTGTQGWTRLSAIATAPSNANYACLQLILSGSGTAYFDDIKLIPRDSDRYTYDANRNYPVTSEDALGNQTQHAYDGIGNELSFTNPLGDTANYSYDSLNRLVQVKDPLGNNAYYQYDSVSNMVYSRDPRSASSSDNTYSTDYSPNPLNQLATLTDPLGQSATYTYDNSGNLTGVSLPDGTSESLTYDSADRLTNVTLSSGQSYTYTYDRADELTGVTDQNGNSSSWSYDGAHRVTGTTEPLGYALSYSWDKSGNPTSLGNSDYGNLQYTYANDNKLSAITLPDGSTINYDYDENGHVFQVQYPGDDKTMTYAQNGWLTEINDPAFSGQPCYNYYYNSDGTISYETSWAGTDTFGYDNDGRLKYWNLSGSTKSGSTPYTYNSADEITSPGFTYDKNGNLTSDGNFNYTYNALDQLVQVNKVSGGSLVATYTYNQDGTRRSKTTSQGTTTYDWDASGNLIKESGPNGTFYYYYDPSGRMIAFKKNGTIYIIHDNQRGDIESVTTESGSVVAQYHYDPWGNQVSYSGTVTLPFGYAGYYYDSETGLYYLKSRYYSPALERFITRDSHDNIKYTNAQTLDLYTYCCDDPVNCVDPTGNGEVWNNFGEEIGTCSGASYVDTSQVATDTLGGGAQASVSWTGSSAPSTSSGPSSGGVVAAGTIVQSAIQAGKNFEAQVGEALGLAKNTTNYGGSVPDFVDEATSYEAKCKDYICNSSQLTIQMQQFGNGFNLIVKQATTFSQPFLDRLNYYGGQISRFVNGEFQAVETSPITQDAVQAAEDIGSAL
ncbi:MAG: RHS repeat-associated core domain-containing protein [Dehalococcoidia bacterium]